VPAHFLPQLPTAILRHSSNTHGGSSSSEVGCQAMQWLDSDWSTHVRCKPPCKSGMYQLSCRLLLDRRQPPVAAVPTLAQAAL
jgi:hypothetical protein